MVQKETWFSIKFHIQYRGQTCIFDKKISNSICNQFSTTFKSKSFADATDAVVYIGYVFGKSIESAMVD